MSRPPPIATVAELEAYCVRERLDGRKNDPVLLDRRGLEHLHGLPRDARIGIGIPPLGETHGNTVAGVYVRALLP